jgi:2-dehydro-3-deoxygluconokinase
MKKKIICIGECMIEITDERLLDRGFQFAGDVYNTAYSLRHGLGPQFDVDFLTALGDDEFSAQMLECWRDDGIGTSKVVILDGDLPGLYIIKTDKKGERRFHYWRGESAAKHFLNSIDFINCLSSLSKPFCIYFSGITLALMQNDIRSIFFQVIEDFRASGTIVAFDSNFRPSLWASSEQATGALQKAWQLTDIALPTLEDEVKLFGDTSAEDLSRKLINFGVSAGVIKLGAEGCFAFDGKSNQFCQAKRIRRVVDTTGAGDAFNGGFLSCYFKTDDVVQASVYASRLAEQVIGHAGAINRCN